MRQRQTNPLPDWFSAARPMPGQARSGDLSLVVPFPGGCLVAAIDGIGHGDEAAAAARAAGEVLRAHADAPVIWLVRRCHEALLETRGVVMSLASFVAQYETLTWIGVGNVEGLLLRADPAAAPSQESLLLRGGVVGFNLPQLAAAVLPLSRGDTLVLATDGIKSSFGVGLAAGRPPRQLAQHVLAEHAKPNDDALVLAAVFLSDGD
ncbi:MAG: SpoIIE family protein phosphatase [Vicinamibacteria bacterium]